MPQPRETHPHTRHGQPTLLPCSRPPAPSAFASSRLRPTDGPPVGLYRSRPSRVYIHAARDYSMYVYTHNTAGSTSRRRPTGALDTDAKAMRSARETSTWRRPSHLPQRIRVAAQSAIELNQRRIPALPIKAHVLCRLAQPVGLGLGHRGRGWLDRIHLRRVHQVEIISLVVILL